MSSFVTPPSKKQTSGDRLHRWKLSWPGNLCLDCGIDDPYELDNAFTDCLVCGGYGLGPTEMFDGNGHVGECEACCGTGCVYVEALKIPPCPGPSMVLFLDYDGVLHPLFAGCQPTFEGAARLREFLLKYPCVSVVVHSSWRFIPGYSEKDVGDVLSLGPELEDRFLGVTPISEPSRWESIQAWMKARPYTGAYVILDDMATSFPTEARPYLISPHHVYGMTENDWNELERRLDAHLQLQVL